MQSVQKDENPQKKKIQKIVTYPSGAKKFLVLEPYQES